MDDFVIVTEENLKEISALLEGRKGKIFIVEPGPKSHGDNVEDAKMDLFDHPFISPENQWLSNPHGVIPNDKATFVDGWKKDRAYILRPRMNRNRRAMKYFYAGSFEFRIDFQGTVGKSIEWDGSGIMLYIPRNNDFRNAFIYGLKFIADQINAHLRKEGKEDQILSEMEISRITDYATQDLKGAKAFRKNLSPSLRYGKG